MNDLGVDGGWKRRWGVSACIFALTSVPVILFFGIGLLLIEPAYAPTVPDAAHSIKVAIVVSTRYFGGERTVTETINYITPLQNSTFAFMGFWHFLIYPALFLAPRRKGIRNRTIDYSVAGFKIPYTKSFWYITAIDASAKRWAYTTLATLFLAPPAFLLVRWAGFSALVGLGVL
jgi:hypothetical protein